MSIFDIFKKPDVSKIELEGEIIKYYSPLYFIPEDINYKLSQNVIEQVRGLLGEKNDISFEYNDAIQFADAGENFEMVSCPYCEADLMEFWGEAMNSCYEEEGFTCLELMTPCCQKITSLHNLVYYFPQGFYKTMIKINPEFENVLTIEQIANELYKITNMQWRVIQPRY